MKLLLLYVMDLIYFLLQNILSKSSLWILHYLSVKIVFFSYKNINCCIVMGWVKDTLTLMGKFYKRLKFVISEKLKISMSFKKNILLLFFFVILHYDTDWNLKISILVVKFLLN